VTNNFDIVLPLRCAVDARESDLERARHGLFPSLARFGYEQLVGKVTIACPRDDLDSLQRQLTDHFPQFNYKFLIDEDVAPAIGYVKDSFGTVPGWLRQQLIKLAAVAQCESEIVLVLDADVIATADITTKMPSTKALPYHAMGIAKFEGWFRASAMALQIDFDSLDPVSIKYAMGVTPEFLWSKTVATMLAHLEKLAGAPDWAPYLMRYFKDYSSTWTEYSLYWIWHIHTADPLTPHYRGDLYKFFESADHINEDIVVSASTLFAVLQSTKLTLADCRPVYEALVKNNG
jgi:hypothetical protein